MVDIISEQSINDFKKGIIKSEERLILTIGRNNNFDVEIIYNSLKDLGITINMVSNIIDSYLILSRGTKVDTSIKELIENDEFIDQNHNILIEIAKMYFYSDSINLENNEIIIKKEINHNYIEDDTPEINVDKAIQMTLQKIKYNKMDVSSISKLHELEEYSKYKKLHDLLIKAIDHESKIQTLDDDSCKMTLDELEQFIR